MFLRRKQFTFGSLHGVSILWRTDMLQTYYISIYVVDAVGSSEILKEKQNLVVTFNFDKQDVIDFTRNSEK